MSFKVTLCNDRALSVYAPSEHSTRKQLTRGRFFEELQNYMENKNMENENKIIIGDFDCAMDKKGTDGGNKIQKFIDVVPIMHRQNSSWIMDSRIYEEGRTKISLSSPTMIDPLAQDKE